MYVCVYFNLILAYLKEWILMKLAILMQADSLLKQQECYGYNKTGELS